MNKAPLVVMMIQDYHSKKLKCNICFNFVSEDYYHAGKQNRRQQQMNQEESEWPIPKIDGLRVVPANEASWEDLEVVLGQAKCHAVRCYCQRFKIPSSRWKQVDDDERAFLLRAQTGCGNPEADTTSGLVAYLDDEPVGWCAVEPRTAYPKLKSSRVPWPGRNEDKDDGSVWAVTCFSVRTGYRHRGITYELARAAAAFARERGPARWRGTR
ncbi:GNAT family N-acetyltransferase [Paenibacillus sp. CC-CFT747]|nr:GNAT family N-acetyltransferase [Paenibacillus sp. CC-CFT747]